MFFAGIDGGGTHTRLELRNENNQLLERRVFGPFNINSIGPDAFRTLLERVFAYCGTWPGAAECVWAEQGFPIP